MSFGLAWVIAVFLELAIFSDTIGDKIKRDHVTTNQPVFQKIDQYQAELSSEVEQRRKNLAALETLSADELAAPAVSETPEPAQFGDFEQQIKGLDAQENELRAELRQVQEQVKTYAADMNAEQLGQRLNAGNSGRAGAGIALSVRQAAEGGLRGASRGARKRDRAIAREARGHASRRRVSPPSGGPPQSGEGSRAGQARPLEIADRTRARISTTRGLTTHARWRIFGAGRSPRPTSRN